MRHWYRAHLAVLRALRSPRGERAAQWLARADHHEARAISEIGR